MFRVSLFTSFSATNSRRICSYTLLVIDTLSTFPVSVSHSQKRQDGWYQVKDFGETDFRNASIASVVRYPLKPSCLNTNWEENTRTLSAGVDGGDGPEAGQQRRREGLRPDRHALPRRDQGGQRHALRRGFSCGRVQRPPLDNPDF